MYTTSLSMCRFSQNPLIFPGDVIPSRVWWEVLGAYSCGGFWRKYRVNLLVRMIKRAVQDDPNFITAPMLDFTAR